MAEYKAPLLLRNGHFNTIYPVLFRRQDEPAYTRQRFDTDDGDFFDVDFIKGGFPRLAILCHGLEGSSHSKYIIGTSGILADKGWDIAAVNHRSCSGEINHSTRMYHSGATWDLDYLVSRMAKLYDEIALVGFSLGGNMVLKYGGEKAHELDRRITSIAAISVPLDLRAGSLHIGRISNRIYERKFLKTLLEKMRIKASQYPDKIDAAAIDRVRSLYEFDDLFTGPLHGFRDADDYYSQCSGKRFLGDIQRPTLVLSALDDPFLPGECYPVALARENRHITMQIPKYGGHVGFVQTGQKYYWDEWRIMAFLERHSGSPV